MSARHTRRPGRALAALGAALAAFAISAVPGVATPVGADAAPGPVEVPLTALYNNRGIAEDVNSTANFDGGGHAYSAAATQLGDPVAGYPGLTAGQAITTGGFSFTWPDRAGMTDNLLARGQQVTIPAVPGATSLGFLGASIDGPSSGTFLLHYVRTDEDGTEHRVTEPRTVRFTDWTRGQFAGNPLEPDNTIVTKALTRHARIGAVDYGYVSHVYVITTPLDPTMVLEAVTLPVSAQIHLFSLSLK
jgi:hypothetical protein